MPLEGSAELCENVILETKGRLLGFRVMSLSFHLKFVHLKKLKSFIKMQLPANGTKTFSKKVSRQVDNKNVGSITVTN